MMTEMNRFFTLFHVVNRRFATLSLRGIFALVPVILFFLPMESQNLVSNPSFEMFRQCPENANQELVPGYEVVRRWFSVSEASPDYFNACAGNKPAGVPRNFAGFMRARTGEGYLGLILKADPRYYHGDDNYTEHIQNQLARPLRPDRLYCFEIWMTLGKNSTIAARNFGVYFSAAQITFPNPPDTLPQPHIAYQGPEYLTDNNNWIVLRGIYRATGGERYLTMGNFEPWDNEGFTRLRHASQPRDLQMFAYYLFDDVSLVEIRDPSECQCNMVTLEVKPAPAEVVPAAPEPPAKAGLEFEEVKVGESVVLKNIFFAFDKSDLLPASFPELDKLVMLMKRYPEMTIEIAGHTDFMGSMEYNLRLSHDRAGSVVRYLVSQGIEPGRLSSKGYGKTVPIADNTTEEGRQLNRRVEFKVLTR